MAVSLGRRQSPLAGAHVQTYSLNSTRHAACEPDQIRSSQILDDFTINTDVGNSIQFLILPWCIRALEMAEVLCDEDDVKPQLSSVGR